MNFSVYQQFKNILTNRFPSELPLQEEKSKSLVTEKPPPPVVCLGTPGEEQSLFILATLAGLPQQYLHLVPDFGGLKQLLFHATF